MKRLIIILTIPAAICMISFQLTSAQGLVSDKYSFQPKSASKAFTYSLLATAVPVTLGTLSAFNNDLGTKELVLISGGLIIGPSVGYYYGGCAERGTTGLIIRLGAGAASALLLAPIVKGEGSNNSYNDFGGGIPYMAVCAIGTSIILLDALADIMDVKYYVVKNNIRRAVKRGFNVTLVPKYFADSSATGMQLHVTF